MIMKLKNKKIMKLYKMPYENMRDLVNIRERLLHNNRTHYNFKKYYYEIDAQEFNHIYVFGKDNNSKRCLLAYETASGQKYEFATYNLSEQDKIFNSNFIDMLLNK